MSNNATPTPSLPPDLQSRARARDLLNEISAASTASILNGTSTPSTTAGGTTSIAATAGSTGAGAGANGTAMTINRGGGGPGANGASTSAANLPTGLDLERLKAEYRAMPDAQRTAAEAELDLRKAALVSARWEAQRDIEAARRQAQIEQLQALQQQGLDEETFYARIRELVPPSA